MKSVGKRRLEKDSIGELGVPEEAYWGGQTQRAIENFPISGRTLPPIFIRTLALIKKAAAQVNFDLGLLDKQRSSTIQEVCSHIVNGEFADQFPIDIFQTGSGTSSNMNMNEVIANRANELLGETKGSKKPIHPNDHVNLGQSSNDIMPTALHLAVLQEMQHRLLPALEHLMTGLQAKAVEFDDIYKIGRTHLQDATPIRLGQEFSGYASQVEHGIHRLRHTFINLGELPLGGTAVGTGINSHPEFAARVISLLKNWTGFEIREASNHFEAQSAKDAVVETAAALKVVAVSLIKIANDIRWLASGPRAGLGEIILPTVQAGSSIMPGKINPVMSESLLQVCTEVIGSEMVISLAGLNSQFELNTMLPLMTHHLLESIRLLATIIPLFQNKLIGNSISAIG